MDVRNSWRIFAVAISVAWYYFGRTEQSEGSGFFRHWEMLLECLVPFISHDDSAATAHFKTLLSRPSSSKCQSDLRKYVTYIWTLCCSVHLITILWILRAHLSTTELDRCYCVKGSWQLLKPHKASGLVWHHHCWWAVAVSQRILILMEPLEMLFQEPSGIELLLFHMQINSR